MKTTCGLALALFATSCAGARTAPPDQAASFEGTVTYRSTVTSPSGVVGKPWTDLVAQKGAKIREEMTPPAPLKFRVVSLLDAASMDLWILDPLNRAYVHFDACEEGQHDGRERSINPLGTHETIAGVECDDYSVAFGDGTSIEVCAAEGMGFINDVQCGGPVPPPWIAVLDEKNRARFAGHGFFVLRSEGQKKSGITVRFEAIRVERHAIDDALFTIPTDYRRMERQEWLDHYDHPSAAKPAPGA